MTPSKEEIIPLYTHIEMKCSYSWDCPVCNYHHKEEFDRYCSKCKSIFKVDRIDSSEEGKDITIEGYYF